MIIGMTIGGIQKQYCMENEQYNMYYSYYVDIDGNNRWCCEDNDSRGYDYQDTAKLFRFIGCDDQERYTNAVSSLTPGNKNVTIITDYVKQNNRQLSISLKLEKVAKDIGFYARTFLSTICNLEQNVKIILHSDKYTLYHDDGSVFRVYDNYMYTCSFSSSALEYNSEDTYYKLVFDIIGDNENIILKANPIYIYDTSFQRDKRCYKPWFWYYTEKNWIFPWNIDPLTKSKSITKIANGSCCTPYHGASDYQLLAKYLDFEHNPKRSLLGKVLCNTMSIQNPLLSTDVGPPYVEYCEYKSGFNFCQYFVPFPQKSYEGLIQLCYYPRISEGGMPPGATITPTDKNPLFETPGLCEYFKSDLKTFLISIGNNFVIKATLYNELNNTNILGAWCIFIKYNLHDNDNPIEVMFAKIREESEQWVVDRSYDINYERSMTIELFGDITELVGGAKKVTVISMSTPDHIFPSRNFRGGQPINSITAIPNDLSDGNNLNKIYYGEGGET